MSAWPLPKTYVRKSTKKSSELANGPPKSGGLAGRHVTVSDRGAIWFVELQKFCGLYFSAESPTVGWTGSGQQTGDKLFKQPTVSDCLGASALRCGLRGRWFQRVCQIGLV